MADRLTVGDVRNQAGERACRTGTAAGDPIRWREVLTACSSTRQPDRHVGQNSVQWRYLACTGRRTDAVAPSVNIATTIGHVARRNHDA